MFWDLCDQIKCERMREREEVTSDSLDGCEREADNGGMACRYIRYAWSTSVPLLEVMTPKLLFP